MAKKLRFRFKRISGEYEHVHKDGRRKTYREGSIIIVHSPSDLTDSLDLWKPLDVKKEKTATPYKKIEIATTETGLPKKAVDGVDTKDFVQDVDLMVSNTLRQTWIDPETTKVYWLDDSGYLSPMNEDDFPPRDKDGEVIEEIKSDNPPLGLKAIHIGGGWYDVVNEKTGEPINDKRLKKKEAENLIDGKIMENPENLAGE